MRIRPATFPKRRIPPASVASVSSAGNRLRDPGFRQDSARQAQHAAYCFCRRGTGKQKSLAESAAQLPQKVVLLACLNPFRHYVHSHHARQLHNGAHNLQRLVALGHARDKRAVDLEHVEGQRVQVVERTVARAEIVHQQ